MSGGLRAVLYSQSKSIVEEFHHRKVAYIQMLLSEEKWERCETCKEHKAYVRYLTGDSDDCAPSPTNKGGKGGTSSEESKGGNPNKAMALADDDLMDVLSTKQKNNFDSMKIRY